jgi:tetratricopeptide (TPR) repeat protein
MQAGEEIFAKNYSAAIGHLNSAIALDPTDFHFYIERGTCFRSLQKYQQALADFNNVCAIGPQGKEKAYSLCNVGMTQLDADMYAAALDTFDQALALMPSLTNVRIEIINAQDHLAKNEAVIEGSTKLLDAQPMDSLVKEQRAFLYLARAKAWLGLKKFAECNRDLAKAEIICGKDQIKLLLLKGQSNQMTGQYDAAIGYFNAMVKLYPRSQISYIARARFYLETAEDERALADATTAVNLNASESALLLRAQIYDDLGKKQQADADRLQAKLVRGD